MLKKAIRINEEKLFPLVNGQGLVWKLEPGPSGNASMYKGALEIQNFGLQRITDELKSGH